MWTGAENIAPPTGLRSLDRPASGETLYRLSYPGPLIIIIIIIIIITVIVTRSLRKNLEAVPGKHSIDSLQKTAILGTSHIIRKVLQCEA